MFPDLDGVGEFVNREYFGQEDMESAFDFALALRRAFGKTNDHEKKTDNGKE